MKNLELDLPESERALEIRVLIGEQSIETALFTRKPIITMGERTRRNRLGRARRLVTRDVELPSWSFTSPMFPLAVLDRRRVSTYLIQLPAGFSGRLERPGAPAIHLAALIALGDRIEPGDRPGSAAYRLACGERLILEHEGATIALSYVRRRELIERPVITRRSAS